MPELPTPHIQYEHLHSYTSDPRGQARRYAYEVRKSVRDSHALLHDMLTGLWRDTLYGGTI